MPFRAFQAHSGKLQATAQLSRHTAEAYYSCRQSSIVCYVASQETRETGNRGTPSSYTTRVHDIRMWPVTFMMFPGVCLTLSMMLTSSDIRPCQYWLSSYRLSLPIGWWAVALLLGGNWHALTGSAFALSWLCQWSAFALNLYCLCPVLLPYSALGCSELLCRVAL